MMWHDGKTIAEIIHEYGHVRGDLTEQYARDQLTAIIEDRITAAEQQGREDNADHGMCYVHGSHALAEHDAEVARAAKVEALREAADTLAFGAEWNNLNPRQREERWPNKVGGYRVSRPSASDRGIRLLRDRADRIEAER